MKWERLAIFLIIVVTLTVFLVPVVHMPTVPNAITVNAPSGNIGAATTLAYLTISGLLAGISPLLLLASLSLGGLLFIYNKSRIPRYSRYYLIGAFAMFFTFQYEMTQPGVIETSIFNFMIMMLMAIVTILLALVAQEFSPGFARRAAKNETVKITFFIFVGALIALAILLYGGGSSSPVISFAVQSSYSTIFLLLIYNVFTILPSIILFTVLSYAKLNIRTRLANNKETLMLVGTVFLFITLLVLELITLFTGQ